MGSQPAGTLVERSLAIARCDHPASPGHELGTKNQGTLSNTLARTPCGSQAGVEFGKKALVHAIEIAPDRDELWGSQSPERGVGHTHEKSIDTAKIEWESGP